MPEEILFFHNPRCSKSREALALLQDKNIMMRVVDYLKEPLSEALIGRIYDGLDSAQRALLVRTKEEEYVVSGLHNNATREEIIHAIRDYPKILERPILLHGTKAAIGRPVENILKILG